MKQVTMHEFCVYTHKYVKENPIVVTKRGIPSFLLLPLEGKDDDSVHIPKEIIIYPR